MRFEKPSEIQASTLPLILDGHNVIAQAQSGAGEHTTTSVLAMNRNRNFILTTCIYTCTYAGKTIAFVIGMLAKINLSQAVPQALCLTPTRELANQILSDAVRPLSSRMNVTFEEALPGRDIAPGSVCKSQVIMPSVCIHVFYYL